jgi:xanthine dehydrogenase accessory factor
MIHFIETIGQCLRADRSVSLATIISQTGSTPRTAGTQMLIMPDGSIKGTIGGGKVEAEVIKAAVKLFGSEEAQIKTFDLNQSEASDDLDIICGGYLSILIESVNSTNDNVKFFQDLDLQCRQNSDCLTITELSQTEDELTIVDRYLILNDGTGKSRFPYPDHVLEQLISKIYGKRSAVLLPVDERLFFVQHHHWTDGTVYIFGAGHVARQLAGLTKMMNFYTIVMDDREEFANRRRFTDSDEIVVLESFEDAFEGRIFDSNSFIVIVTRAHSHDKTVLAHALKTDAGYIGMIGSRRKRNIIYEKLLADKFSQADIDRVHSPIGLDITAETPEEIAVSIIAELIQTRAEKRNPRNDKVPPDNA